MYTCAAVVDYRIVGDPGGYDETTITYMNNGFFYSVPIDVFLIFLGCAWKYWRWIHD